ncbi:MAG TPA: hypothetical protein VKR79_12485 [Gaiellaceae bacterium]|nr:hypothetical protein [Gaiellaceae bacterium]
MAQTTAKVPFTPGEDHHVGFNKALAQALKQMDADFGPGPHTVDVQFQLEAEVHSPGTIGFYKITLTG